jgi:pyruvate/2-oxoglutarate/acetoin dehydrogenase E1 component
MNSALDLALATDPKVLLLGEDIADPSGGVFKVTKGLSTRHGTSRVRDIPIAEQSILGAALAGYRPVAEVMFWWHDLPRRRRGPGVRDPGRHRHRQRHRPARRRDDRRG